MNINFTKEGSRYVSAFEVTADFNLHIEGVKGGNISVFQRGSASGDYAYVEGSSFHTSEGNVFDYDFSALVYPKYIKVICSTKPTMAVVTMA
jgi:hypothetical protein